MNAGAAGRAGVLREIAVRVMGEQGLLAEFSGAAQAQAAAVATPPCETGGAVADLRDKLWMSIDNDDSLDLDQVSVAEPSNGGTVRVFLGIADVAAMVPRDSPIDRHAACNTTSVYTAAQIFPMIPERLSTQLTSLMQDQDRPALIIELSIDPQGNVTESTVYQGIVRNRAKLAYDSVAAWLDGRGAIPAPVAAISGMEEQLRIQDGLARSLKKLRHAHGGLTLQTSEARPVFESGALEDLRADETNRAKNLIEDLMIAGNTAVARFLKDRQMPSLRRNLPPPERWSDIVAVAAKSGELLPAAPNAVALNEFLVRRRQADPEHFADLSLTIVKLLGRGEYVAERPGADDSGHFGLAIRDYTHSTAPNRRFVDLITQRLIKATLRREASPYTMEELAALAAHCTAQESCAAKVERAVRKSAAAILLAGRIGQVFDGMVTGASAKGTWVRIAAPATEGKITRGFVGLNVGDRVRVQLIHTDVERGLIDFMRST
ncbi:MAG: RNB domain-containing ribonuclease [Steroidobacteraceae bacterium]